MHNNSQHSDLDHDVSVDEGYLRKFANQMLKGRIFIGTYSEKHYVEPLSCYRDIVFVNPMETDLIKSLHLIRSRIQEKYNQKWTGITEHNNSINLWVELENQVLGSYWYTIKRIKFRNKEILLELNQVRCIEEVQENIRLIQNDSQNISISATTDILKEKLKEVALNVWTSLTYQNIKATIIFISILLFTTITFLSNAIQFLIIHLQRFLREISFFITSVTPIVQSVLALVERVIGWFFILIAMIWKDFRNPAPSRRIPVNMLQYGDRQQQSKMLMYRRQPGVIITEVTD